MDEFLDCFTMMAPPSEDDPYDKCFFTSPSTFLEKSTAHRMITNKLNEAECQQRLKFQFKNFEKYMSKAENPESLKPAKPKRYIPCDFEPVYPKASVLDKFEMETCFNLTLRCMRSDASREEERVLGGFLARLKEEREEFHKFVSYQWRKENFRRYLHMPPAAKEFIEQHWQTKLNAVMKSYPKFYNKVITIPLVYDDISNPIQMKPEQILLRVGESTRMNTPLLRQKHVLEIKENCATKENSDSPDQKEAFYQKPVSCDETVENLAKENDVNFVLTSSSFKKLVDNHLPNFATSWELPIIVKEFKMGKAIKRVIFIEKALPPTNLSTAEKSKWFAKKAGILFLSLDQQRRNRNEEIKRNELVNATSRENSTSKLGGSGENSTKTKLNHSTPKTDETLSSPVSSMSGVSQTQTASSNSSILLANANESVQNSPKNDKNVTIEKSGNNEILNIKIEKIDSPIVDQQQKALDSLENFNDNYENERLSEKETQNDEAFSLSNVDDVNSDVKLNNDLSNVPEDKVQEKKTSQKRSRSKIKSEMVNEDHPTLNECKSSITNLNACPSSEPGSELTDPSTETKSAQKSKRSRCDSAVVTNEIKRALRNTPQRASERKLLELKSMESQPADSPAESKSNLKSKGLSCSSADTVTNSEENKRVLRNTSLKPPEKKSPRSKSQESQPDDNVAESKPSKNPKRTIGESQRVLRNTPSRLSEKRLLELKLEESQAADHPVETKSLQKSKLLRNLSDPATNFGDSQRVLRGTPQRAPENNPPVPTAQTRAAKKLSKTSDILDSNPEDISDQGIKLELQAKNVTNENNKELEKQNKNDSKTGSLTQLNTNTNMSESNEIGGVIKTQSVNGSEELLTAKSEQKKESNSKTVQKVQNDDVAQVRQTRSREKAVKKEVKGENCFNDVGDKIDLNEKSGKDADTDEDSDDASLIIDLGEDEVNKLKKATQKVELAATESFVKPFPKPKSDELGNKVSRFFNQECTENTADDVKESKPVFNFYSADKMVEGGKSFFQSIEHSKKFETSSCNESNTLLEGAQGNAHNSSIVQSAIVSDVEMQNADEIDETVAEGEKNPEFYDDDDNQILKARRNVNYALWTLHKQDMNNTILLKTAAKSLKLIIRSKNDGVIQRRRFKEAVNITSKVEYNSEFGASCSTLSESTQGWASLLIKPNSCLARIRAHYLDYEVMMTEMLRFQDACHELKRLYNVSPQNCYNTLYSVLNKLTDLTAGNYVLRHEPRDGAFAVLFKASNTDFGTYNLHRGYQINLTMPVQNEQCPYLPIDTFVMTPYHHFRRKIPATFHTLFKIPQTVINQRKRAMLERIATEKRKRASERKKRNRKKNKKLKADKEADATKPIATE